MHLVLLFLAACTPEKPAGDDSGKPPYQPIDADSDGYDASVDCDDAHATVNPDAPELCDGVDNNCNDEVDEEAEDAPLWYADADGDGYGESLIGASCTAPAEAAEQGGDCDDQRADIHPGAAETDCADPTDYNCDGSVAFADADSDGFAACNDCDDADAAVSPEGVESCNSRDDNCDGNVDEGLDLPWYTDADGDGYGDVSAPLWACAAPVGAVADATDCDDGDPGRNPGLVELCDAANTDEDCDGLSDDTDSTVSGTSTWYLDQDGDGYGDTAVAACDMGAGMVATAGDCDDGNAAVAPGATELCDGANTDEDCNGQADDADSAASGKSTYYMDSDGDSYGAAAVLACDAPAGSVSNSSDCDDSNAAIHPGATELCDAANTDEDCDGYADDTDGDVSGKSSWYLDSDRDGYGSSSLLLCDAPSGYVAAGGDCNDSQGAIHPGGSEVCDAANTDEDCDGVADDGDSSVSGTSTWYQDSDGDGYGAAATSACDRPGGYVATGGDCNDQSATVNPGGTELCDVANTDEDCDGLADDTDSNVSGKSTGYADSDGDGYGNSSAGALACDTPSGTTAVGGDCNDTNSAVSPAATEVCDAQNSDEDCDGLTDDTDSSATGKTAYYADMDGDGYAGSSSSSFCDAPSGYYSSSSDCNDSSAAIRPGATELCDAANTDEDCDGLVDDTDPSVSGQSSWYVDSDGDGYGSAAPVSACDAPAGSVSSSSDCNDASAAISPGATDICGDSVDQDCSGADRSCPGWSGSESADANYDHKIYGIGLQAAFGVGLAGGDFDGDGLGDLLVGDSGYNYSGAAAGAVFGYYGPIYAGAWTASYHDDFLDYNTSSSYDGIYGSQIANLGDVSADGLEDYLVMANSNTSLSYRGGHTGLSTYGYYMRSLPCNSGGALGDWDGGTNHDYFCADSTYSVSKGTVYLYSGTSTSSSGSYTGESSSDYAGHGAAAGDFDGDGLDDLVVGAYGNDSGGSEAGAVYLILSPGTYGSRLVAGPCSLGVGGFGLIAYGAQYLCTRLHQHLRDVVTHGR